MVQQASLVQGAAHQRSKLTTAGGVQRVVAGMVEGCHDKTRIGQGGGGVMVAQQGPPGAM